MSAVLPWQEAVKAIPGARMKAVLLLHCSAYALLRAGTTAHQKVPISHSAISHCNGVTVVSVPSSSQVGRMGSPLSFNLGIEDNFEG